MTGYDCAKEGHVWLEESGLLYSRHGGRKPGLVPVRCRHCGKTTEFEGHGKATATPPSTDLINHGPKHDSAN